MSRGKMVKRICKWCGKEFEARQADVNRGWGKFCSKHCKAMEQESRTGQYKKHKGLVKRVHNSGKVEYVTRQEMLDDIEENGVALSGEDLSQENAGPFGDHGDEGL